MTKIFIEDPKTGKLRTAEEMNKEAGGKRIEADYIVIVPDDGSPAFKIPKTTFPERPWKEAKEMVEEMAKQTGEPWKLPTRKQWIDIREARSCGLDQVLDSLKGGSDLLRKLIRGEWFWTSEVWVKAGTSAEDYEKEKENAVIAWFSVGVGGYANYNDVYYSILALPLLLYNFREANL